MKLRNVIKEQRACKKYQMQKEQPTGHKNASVKFEGTTYTQPTKTVLPYFIGLNNLVKFSSRQIRKSNKTPAKPNFLDMAVM